MFLHHRIALCVAPSEIIIVPIAPRNHSFSKTISPQPVIPLFQSWKCKWFRDLQVQWEHLKQIQTITYSQIYSVHTCFVLTWAYWDPMDLSHLIVFFFCTVTVSLYVFVWFQLVWVTACDCRLCRYTKPLVWFKKKNDTGHRMNHSCRGYSPLNWYPTLHIHLWIWFL